MTIQAKEIMTLKGNHYEILNQDPLEYYMRKHKDEWSFSFFTTAHWRGYQGYWTIYNDKLYLVQLENRDFSLKQIFGTNGPVFAEWFFGFLEIKLGDSYEDENKFNHTDYLILEIRHGIVKEKKLIKGLEQYSRIYEGYYEGRTLNNILYGKVSLRQNEGIYKYLVSLLDYFCHSGSSFVPRTPRLTDLDEEVKKLIWNARNHPLEYFCSPHFIALSTMQPDWKFYEAYAKGISELLEKTMKMDFRELELQSFDNASISGESEHSFLLNPDMERIAHEIKNNNDFIILPHNTVGNFEIKRLCTFSIKRIHDTIFEYEPVFEKIVYSFSEDLRRINKEKFENTFNYKYDEKLNYYKENLSPIEENDKIEKYLY